MINTLATLRTFLAAQSALTDLTGARIWAGRTYPPQGYKPSDGAAVVFNGRGGSGLEIGGRLLRDSVQFKCYAADPISAFSLYGVLVEVLHDATSVEIHSAQLEIAGQLLTEPEPVGWPFVLAFFEVIFDSQLGA